MDRINVCPACNAKSNSVKSRIEFEHTCGKQETTQNFECDHCDGCGWVEGGITLKTQCEKCEGTGMIKGKGVSFKMAKKQKFILAPLREWGEKEGEKVLDSVRIYCGSLHIGTCHLGHKNDDKYTFSSIGEGIMLDIPTKAMTIDEIKTEVELGLKELLNKITK